ncbi:F117A protein, partial [Formicarius rufipectus]|nr:F117A protein [Formicarius rufipectus]
SPQTPPWWPEAKGDSAGSHRRSASGGSCDHRREVARLKQQLQHTPLAGRGGQEKPRGCSVLPGDPALLPSLPDPPGPGLGLSPRLQRSLEGLNRELEEAFVSEPGDEQLLRVLDVPDGHRAPAPSQPDSLDASLALEPGSGSWSSRSSLSPSLSPSFSPSLQSPGRPGVPEPKEKAGPSPSPEPPFASSPRPNHSFVFQREPPEGCERVRALEDTPAPVPAEPFQPSCPDRNKVHFCPSGSAFCPVRLMVPLLPRVGLLLRAFPSPFLPELPRNCERWKRGQPEDTALFHSSLVA